MNEQEMNNAVATTAKSAKSFKITSKPKLLAANDILKEIKVRRKSVADFFNPLISNAHVAHKALTTKKKEVEAPLVEAETYFKKEVSTYLTKLRKIEEEKAEKLRLAEQARLEEERALAAEAAKADGDDDLAEAILEEEVQVTTVVSKSTPKLDNISVKETWKFEVTDLISLCKAVAEGRVPIEAIKSNDVFLGQQARSLRKSLNYPGVNVYSDSNINVRK